MKVQVTLRQVLTYEITQEVEMTLKEYNDYIKNGNYSTQLKNDVAHDIDDTHWICTEEVITNIEK